MLTVPDSGAVVPPTCRHDEGYTLVHRMVHGSTHGHAAGPSKAHIRHSDALRPAVLRQPVDSAHNRAGAARSQLIEHLERKNLGPGVHSRRPESVIVRADGTGDVGSVAVEIFERIFANKAEASDNVIHKIWMACVNACVQHCNDNVVFSNVGLHPGQLCAAVVVEG